MYGENLYFGRVLRVTDNPLLQEIRLPELSELAVGSALFINCSKLCYVRYSIQWAALQPQGTAKNNFSGAALQASCKYNALTKSLVTICTVHVVTELFVTMEEMQFVTYQLLPCCW